MNYRRLFIKNGLLFITIVTNNRQPILINNIKIIKQCAINVMKIYKYKLLAYCILNDHIHCVIKPKNVEDYPKIIKSFKYSFTKNVGLVKPTYSYEVASSKSNKIWQSRYWEHTIRDEQDFYKHIDYIHYNSYKHYKIAPKDWIYSSFLKFINKGYYENNWCNDNDINEINQLELE